MNEFRQEVAELRYAIQNPSATVLIGQTAMRLTNCSVLRQTSNSERLLRTEATTMDTVRQQVMVTIHDTLREVTIISLQQNDQGDTLKLVQVTDHTRGSRSRGCRDREEKTVVKNQHGLYRKARLC